MLVKIWLYLTKSVITGDVDEVRVQSEEPNFKKPAFEQAFCFSVCLFPCGRKPGVTAGTFVSLTRALTLPSGERQRFPLYSHVTG